MEDDQSGVALLKLNNSIVYNGKVYYIRRSKIKFLLNSLQIMRDPYVYH